MTEDPQALPDDFSSAQYVYDGDDNMVKSVIDGVTTYYVGGIYELRVEDSVETEVKYYYAASRRIAMRTITSSTDTLYWLISDHLSSTTIVTNESGTIVSEMKYSAFGEIRDINGSSPTDYLYTGQRKEVEFGLSYYVARWYDISTGHFTSADSLIPQLGDSGAWDRFAYVLNNPLKYTDSTGHWIDPFDPDMLGTPDARSQQIQHYENMFIAEMIFEPFYGVIFSDTGGFENLFQTEVVPRNLQAIDELNYDTSLIYINEGIDLWTVAYYGLENPLEYNQVMEHSIDPMGFTLHTVIGNQDHVPYQLFLATLAEDLGNPEILNPKPRTSNNSAMQYESNYLAALMVEYPESLNKATSEFNSGINFREILIGKGQETIMSNIIDQLLPKLLKMRGGGIE